jgi:hypothetical protein
MEELNAALDRSLIGDALARLSPQHRAVLRRSYYLGGQPRRSPTTSASSTTP